MTPPTVIPVASRSRIERRPISYRSVCLSHGNRGQRPDVQCLSLKDTGYGCKSKSYNVRSSRQPLISVTIFRFSSTEQDVSLVNYDHNLKGQKKRKKEQLRPSLVHRVGVVQTWRLLVNTLHGSIWGTPVVEGTFLWSPE